MDFLQYVLAGLGVGVVFGLFGAGGSAFATPVLALMGVPGLLAVASPLPAMIPASFVGARRYLRSGHLDLRVARLAVIGGVPGAVVGALASNLVGGPNLLVLSGLLLFGIGVRLVLPDRAGAAHRAAGRRDRTWIVIGSAFGVGLLTGLLANGGGFLLVPVFVLILGLDRGGGGRHLDGRRRDPDHPDPRDPLGARPHRLDGCFGLRGGPRSRLRRRAPGSRNASTRRACGERSASCSSCSRSSSWSASSDERECHRRERERQHRDERRSFVGRADIGPPSSSGRPRRTGSFHPRSRA